MWIETLVLLYVHSFFIDCAEIRLIRRVSPRTLSIMIKIFNKSTNEFLGRISQTDFQFLRDHLESEGIHDRDYFLRKTTVTILAGKGAGEHLISVLQGGIRSDETIEIRWEEE
jgi:hypothetical protein